MTNRLKTAVFVGVGPVDKHFKSPELPLHVPIVPMFDVDPRRNGELSDELKKRVSRFNIFRITGLEAILIGPNKDIPARDVGGSCLYPLHDEVCDAVKRFDRSIDKTSVGDNYNPYAIDTAAHVLEQNQAVSVQEVYIAQQSIVDENWRLINSDGGKLVQYLLKTPDPAMYRADLSWTNK